MSITQAVFYGTGNNAEQNLQKWFGSGIVPACFVDADTHKHYTQFHGYDVLPLDEALLRFPDSDIYITLANRNLLSATKHLLSNGVKQENIKYFEDVAYGKGCWQLEGHMHCTAFLKPCSHWHYSASDCIELTGDFKANYNSYVDTINRLKQNLLSDKPCGCSGCSEVKIGLWSKTFKPRLFALHDDIKGERCNCRCIYCDLTKSGGHIRNGKYTAPEILNSLGGYFPAKTMFYYAPAELTVSPHKKEIYAYLRDRDWEFSVVKTSGIAFDAELAEFVSHGGRVNVSLDSGTKETYAKVKGVDCFDKVVANLEKYKAVGAKIELKYILLENLNDSEADFDGFMDIAQKLSGQIILTVDMNTLQTGIPESMWTSLTLFAEKIKNYVLPVRLHSEHLSNENYERLSKLVCSN